MWFYTPNGFVIGKGAAINVGGLLMTTNDIVYGAANTGGDMLTDANGNVLLRGAAGATGSIVNDGTLGGNNPQTNPLIAGSYIALVAPHIEQRGSVYAGKSIAYVAAESGRSQDQRRNVRHRGEIGGRPMQAG